MERPQSSHQKQVNTWTNWSPCSKSCHWGDIGQSRRARSIVVPPQRGGEAGPSLDATKTCNDVPCPVDCKVETNMTRGQILKTKLRLVLGAVGAPAQGLATLDKVRGEDLWRRNLNTEEYLARFSRTQRRATNSCAPSTVR